MGQNKPTERETSRVFHRIGNRLNPLKTTESLRPQKIFRLPLCTTICHPAVDKLCCSCIIMMMMALSWWWWWWRW